MTKTNNNGGIGFIGLLTIVFITLKLTGYIDWSWWWVVSPIWILCLLILMAFVVFFIIALIRESQKK